MSTMGAMMLDGAARTATRRSPRTPGAPAHISSPRVLVYAQFYSAGCTATGDYLAYSQ